MVSMMVLSPVAVLMLRDVGARVRATDSRKVRAHTPVVALMDRVLARSDAGLPVSMTEVRRIASHVRVLAAVRVVTPRGVAFDISDITPGLLAELVSAVAEAKGAYAAQRAAHKAQLATRKAQLVERKARQAARTVVTRTVKSSHRV